MDKEKAEWEENATCCQLAGLPWLIPIWALKVGFLLILAPAYLARAQHLQGCMSPADGDVAAALGSQPLPFPLPGNLRSDSCPTVCCLPDPCLGVPTNSPLPVGLFLSSWGPAVLLPALNTCRWPGHQSGHSGHSYHLRLGLEPTQ